MPPLRALFFAIMAVMLMAYGSILLIGGYETGNNLQLNSSIASNYNSITSVTSCNSYGGGGLFGNLTSLCQAANNSASKVNQSAGNSAGAVVNSVSLVIGFMTSIPAIFGAIINFIASPLVSLGINKQFAESIITVIILGILGLSIISAIFLFPIFASPGYTRKKGVRI